MDREKVKKELLELNAEAYGLWVHDQKNEFLAQIGNVTDDALALLKKVEAVEPRRDANCARMFRCGACGEYVGFIDSDPGDPNEQDNYCRNCGRQVKWE